VAMATTVRLEQDNEPGHFGYSVLVKNSVLEFSSSVFGSRIFGVTNSVLDPLHLLGESQELLSILEPHQQCIVGLVDHPTELSTSVDKLWMTTHQFPHRFPPN